MAFSLFLTVFTALFAFLTVFFNWDSVCLVIYILKNTVFSTYLLTLWFQIFYFISQLFRFGFIFLVSNWLMVNIRTMVILLLTSGTSFVSLETLLLKNCQIRLSNSILLYKQLIVARNTLLPFEKAAVTVFLTGVFFFLLLCMSAIEAGIVLGNPIISISGALVGIIVLTIFVVTINLCCLIYEKSVKIRNLWKWRIQNGCDTKYFRKVIKSLKPLYVPAGDMGKVDKDMKMNYSHAVLVNSANLLIGLGEFVVV